MTARRVAPSLLLLFLLFTALIGCGDDYIWIRSVGGTATTQPGTEEVLFVGDPTAEGKPQILVVGLKIIHTTQRTRWGYAQNVGHIDGTLWLFGGTLDWQFAPDASTQPAARSYSVSILIDSKKNVLTVGKLTVPFTPGDTFIVTLSPTGAVVGLTKERP